MFNSFKQHMFLFEELTKRDFKKKYKRSVLGMGWSILSPLLQLLVLSLVFKNFFGRNMEHYTIYLFCGNLLYGYFKEATKGGMNSLVMNKAIITKINVPKYIFLLSKNISSLINFLINIGVFFVFCLVDGICFKWSFTLLIIPIVCLVIFNIGVGMILSAFYCVFKDVSYLYDIFTMLLMYMSAIFYTVDILPLNLQNCFYLNPVFCFIKYFRVIVVDGMIPSLGLHALCIGYAALLLILGCITYKKMGHKFVYYL